MAPPRTALTDFLDQGWGDMSATLGKATIRVNSGRWGGTTTYRECVLLHTGGTYSVELGGSFYAVEYEACVKLRSKSNISQAGDTASLTGNEQTDKDEKFLVVESVFNQFDNSVHLKLARL